MAWTIMHDVMQWMDVNGDPASGYVIKAYEPGTTTPISIAIDRTGGSPQATITLNAEGKPEVSGNEVMLFIDRDYKWAIFENATDAGNNSNPYAGFFDNIPQQNASSSIDYDGNSTINQKLNNLDVNDYTELRALTSSQLVDGDSVTVTDDGIAGIFTIKTGTVTDNGGTLIVFSDDSNRYAERQYNQWVSLLWFGFSEQNTAAENAAIVTNTMRNFGLNRGYFLIPKLTTGVYPIDLFNPNNNDIVGEDITLSFSYNASKTVTMGQITDCIVSGITFDSTETDLENQRCQVARSDIKACKFTNWRNPTNSNSWGIYIDDGERVRLIDCGFQNNTQSDIALVDNAANIYIENCYAIDDASDPLHVNCEPNTSSENNILSINLCDLGQLSLLENGSGSTANKSIIVNGCQIDTLKLDGARAAFNSCQITDFINETNVFFGEVDFINTLALGPNLILDPFMMNIGFNASTAATDSNSWYLNGSSGVGTDYHEPMEEGGIRFLRINDQFNTGSVTFRPTTPISATSGDYYLVAITGRRANGSDGRFCQVYDGVTDKDCFVFRQSTGGFDYFTTELAIIPAAATNDFLIKIGTYQSTTSSCDIYAVSVHKVLGSGANAREMLSGIHSIKPGVRSINVSTVPTLSNADTLGFMPGDKAIDTTTGIEHVFDGASLIEYPRLLDGITAPSATVGLSKMYIDTSDGDLKIIFGDGTIKTIVTDT